MVLAGSRHVALEDCVTTTIDPEVFDRCAERIERKGMVKGGYYREWVDDGDEPIWRVGEKIREGDLKCCSLGAIAAEIGDGNLYNDFETYSDFFARVIGLGDNFEVPEWNDLPSRRKAHLVKAFRKAAAHARGSA